MEYDVLLSFKISHVVQLIKDHFEINEIDALDMLYNSKTYCALEDKSTGLYQRSAVNIFNIFLSELNKVTV